MIGAPVVLVAKHVQRMLSASVNRNWCSPLAGVASQALPGEARRQTRMDVGTLGVRLSA